MAAWQPRQDMDRDLALNREEFPHAAADGSVRPPIYYHISEEQVGTIPTDPRVRARPLNHPSHAPTRNYSALTLGSTAPAFHPIPLPHLRVPSYPPPFNFRPSYETSAFPSLPSSPLLGAVGTHPMINPASLPESSESTLPSGNHMLHSLPRQPQQNQILPVTMLHRQFGVIQSTSNVPGGDVRQQLFNHPPATHSVQLSWRPQHVQNPHSWTPFTNSRPPPKPIQYPNPRLRPPGLPHDTATSTVGVATNSGMGCVLELQQHSLADDPFISNWLKEVERKKPHEREMHRHQPKLVEVRSQLIKGVELLSLMKHAHQTLKSDPMANLEKHELLKKKVAMYRSEFLSLRSSLDQSGLKEHCRGKVMRLQAIRERKRKKWRTRKSKWLKKVSLLESRTDEWVKAREEKKLKAKTEKEVQASMAEVLDSVQKKKSEVKELLSMAEILGELRALRRDASRKKGNAPLIEEDEKFAVTQKELVDLLTRQLEVYDKEEHALRVLMEEEVKEKMHSRQTKVVTSASSMASQQGVNQVVSMLAPPVLPDPLEAYRGFYHQASHSKEAMKAIRSEWGLFQCSEGSPLPDHMLTRTAAPADHNWSVYLIT